MDILNEIPKEVTIAVVSAATPIVLWLLKLLVSFIFSLFEKSLTQAFKGITDRLDILTDRLDRFEDLVRDLIKTTTENTTLQDINSKEIKMLRDRVHYVENVMTVITTNCEMCDQVKMIKKPNIG